MGQSSNSRRTHLATPVPGEMVEPCLALDLRGGDVWAWEKRLTGACRGVPADATIALLVNGEPVLASRDGESFAATARLVPGANDIVAVATLPGGGELRSEPVTHTVKLVPRPVARIATHVSDDVVTFDGNVSETSDFDHVPLRSWSWSERPGNPSPLLPSGQRERDGSSLTVTTPTIDGEYAVTLEVTDAAGRSDSTSACLIVEDGLARAMDPVTERAGWIDAAVVYGMVVRNFTSGGFRDAASRMAELADLGVSAIWLAPITRAPDGDFGYAVTDYFDVRPDYGTLDDFRDLVDAAHRHGIRVLMDFVPNHTSDQHPYFVGADTHGEQSPSYHWFDRDEHGAPTHYFSWEHLPNLNFEHPEVRRFMTEAFTFWMREYGVDGFRVDVAWGIRERRPDYWLEWSAELNRIRPDSLLIAEASARDPFYIHHGFDASYDWTGDLGVWAWTEAFTGDEPIPAAMHAALTNDGSGYDPDSLVFRFLNNNDTGDRFITTHGIDCYRTALAMLMTLPGIPCIFTGDEVGAEYQPYATVGEIDWADPHNLRAFTKRLIQLRTEHPALYGRSWQPLAVEPAESLLCYLRSADDGSESILVALNFSEDPVQMTAPEPDGLAQAGSLVDLWNGDFLSVAPTGRLETPMPGWGVRIMQGATS